MTVCDVGGEDEEVVASVMAVVGSSYDGVGVCRQSYQLFILNAVIVAGGGDCYVFVGGGLARGGYLCFW